MYINGLVSFRLQSKIDVFLGGLLIRFSRIEKQDKTLMTPFTYYRQISVEELQVREAKSRRSQLQMSPRAAMHPQVQGKRGVASKISSVATDGLSVS